MKELPSLLSSSNILKTKSTLFAVRIIRLTRHLQKIHGEYVLSKQLIRSGTSIGANVRESEKAESADDFIHKLSIAQKETNETIYWLELYYADEMLSKQEFRSIYQDVDELMRLITSSILTKKKNRMAKRVAASIAILVAAVLLFS